MKFERKIFKPSLQPMDFICMDLIGEFHPPTSCGHRYALTAVCMLTVFTWCIPLKTKTAEEVAKAHMDHIYCNFGRISKYSQTTGQNSRTNFSKKLSINKVQNFLFIHPLTDHKVMGKLKDFTDS